MTVGNGNVVSEIFLQKGWQFADVALIIIIIINNKFNNNKLQKFCFVLIYKKIYNRNSIWFFQGVISSIGKISNDVWWGQWPLC